MNRRNAIAAISLVPLASGQTNKGTARDQFTGIWRLVKFESKDRTTGEARYPFGANPVGRITYDQAGRMSAQLMDPRRRAIGGRPDGGTAAALLTMSDNDMREILTGCVSYFGIFDIEESSSTVIHHVQACLFPSWVGAQLRRGYQFPQRNRLILTLSNQKVVSRLSFDRES